MEAVVVPARLKFIAQLVINVISSSGFLEGFPFIEPVLQPSVYIEALMTTSDLGGFLEGNPFIEAVDDVQAAPEATTTGQTYVLGGK